MQNSCRSYIISTFNKIALYGVVNSPLNITRIRLPTGTTYELPYTLTKNKFTVDFSCVEILIQLYRTFP